MPINVEHNVDPRLLGQAAYQSGQGMGARDALALLAKYGAGGGGSPRQQSFDMGRMAPTGVQNVSDALANGDMGGDPGLQQDMSLRQGDTGGSLYDPSLSPPAPAAAPNPNSIYNRDGTTNDNFYGGAEGEAAYQQGLEQRGAPLDDASQYREDGYNKRIEMLHNDDRFDQSVKDDAIKKILAEKQKALSARPYTYKKSAQQNLESNLAFHPDGTSYIQQPDGSLMPHAPEAPADPAPIDPSDPATMQQSQNAQALQDPSQPPTDPMEDLYNRTTWTAPDGTVYQHTGKKWDVLRKPEKKEKPKVEKSESEAQFGKDYQEALKHLTEKDADDNVIKKPTDDDIENYIRKKHELYKRVTGKTPAALATHPIDQNTPTPDDMDAAAAQRQNQPQQIVSVGSAQDYAAVPRGAQYRDVYGHIRIKQ